MRGGQTRGNDTVRRDARSALMARIRSCGNHSTEGRLAAALRQSRIRGWRRQLPVRIAWTRHRSLVVRPDFVFRHERVAVFVDGCFWHLCPAHATVPKTNSSYWNRKLLRNRARDRQQTKQLRAAGWRVVRIWEHDLTSDESRCLSRIGLALGYSRKRDWCLARQARVGVRNRAVAR